MAKTVTVKTFVAFDGTEFKTREEAEAHENEGFLKQFANWKSDRVEAADKGDTDKGKKDGLAIEAWALRLREKRIERGEVKRVVKTKEQRDAAKAEAAKAAEDKAAADAAKTGGQTGEHHDNHGAGHHQSA
jgi:hypothetical protein